MVMDDDGWKQGEPKMGPASDRWTIAESGRIYMDHQGMGTYCQQDKSKIILQKMLLLIASWWIELWNTDPTAAYVNLRTFVGFY